MPLYEFRCPQGHDFEKFYRSIGGAQSAEPCPECGAIASRVMSAAGLVFKGSGFYITDYGKDGKKAEREAATAKTEAGTKAAAAADAKSAAAETPSAKPASEPAPAPAAKTSSEPAPKAAPAPAPKKTE